MSANANDMSRLLKKISRRLGLIPLLPHLPEGFTIDDWADVIKEDSMVTFSRYFPNKIVYLCNSDTIIMKDGWYYLRDDIIGANKVLGITDIDWTTLGSNNMGLSAISDFGYPAAFGPIGTGTGIYSAEQAMTYALGQDLNSLYSSGNSAYVETDEGNPMRFKVVGISGRSLSLQSFAVNVLVEHKDLATISPTKMNTFEELAQADVANYLYENLKYFDELETVYVQINLKMDRLRDEAGKRENIIEKLENAYVSASNNNQPLIVVN